MLMALKCAGVLSRIPSLRPGTRELQRGVWQCGYSVAAFLCTASPSLASLLKYDDTIASLLHSADADTGALLRQPEKMATFIGALRSRARSARQLAVFRRRFTRAYSQVKA